MPGPHRVDGIAAGALLTDAKAMAWFWIGPHSEYEGLLSKLQGAVLTMEGR